MIKNSLGWVVVESNFLKIAKSIPNNKDLMKMIKNIENQVSELSKLEVQDRQRKTDKSLVLLETINKDIDVVEEFLLLAKLIS